MITELEYIEEGQWKRAEIERTRFELVPHDVQPVHWKLYRAQHKTCWSDKVEISQGWTVNVVKPVKPELVAPLVFAPEEDESLWKCAILNPVSKWTGLRTLWDMKRCVLHIAREVPVENWKRQWKKIKVKTAFFQNYDFRFIVMPLYFKKNKRKIWQELDVIISPLK